MFADPSLSILRVVVSGIRFLVPLDMLGDEDKITACEINSWKTAVMKPILDAIDHIRWKVNQIKEERFERKYDVETALGESEYLKEIDTGNADYAIPYQAIQFDVFTKMMNHLLQIVDNTSNYTFIDLGSGKGRALMYSAKYPFKKLIGIEFSKSLHEKAIKNIASYQRTLPSSNEFELHCMDVEHYDFPENNIVLFMYNPFIGKVMRSVSEKIMRFIKQQPFDFIILYRNPTCADLFNHASLNIITSNRSYNIYQKRSNHRL